MNFNIIAVLLSAITLSFVAAVTDEKLGKSDKHVKLAAAPPVRGGKKHHRSSSVATSSTAPSSTSASASLSSSSSVKRSRSSRAHSVLESASHEKTKVCTRELEAIVFSPPSTVKEYMSKIADEMRTDIQVIMAAFSGGNLDYLRTYINKYNILITLFGPFGKPVLITSTFVAYTAFIQSVALAQTYSGRDGFYVDVATQYYNYQFTLMSANGQLINFVLSLPLSAMTNTPTNCK